MKALLVATLLLSAIPAALADQPVMTDQQKRDEIRAMPWVSKGTVPLATSKSSIALPAGYVAISAADARRFDYLINAEEDPDIEAVVVNNDSFNFVMFEYLNEGYVSIDDWNEVDASKMLEQVRDATEAANAARRQQNIAELHVTGWLKEPALDRKTNVVFWVLNVHSSDGDLVNAVALRLGRYGYEKMIWVADAAAYKKGPDDQKAMLQSHKFDAGATYADHISGDKMAGYGIASLVALAAGVKVAQAAGLLLLVKKFGIVILAALAGAAAWVKRKFRRKPGT